MPDLSTAPLLERLYEHGKRLPVSFEVFPPKTAEGRANLRTSVGHLADADPAFVSVTSSPDGSSEDRTIGVATEIQDQIGCPATVHLTAYGYTAEQIDRVADRLWQAGVRHILALRGDRPDNAASVPRAYPHAAELVRALKRRHGFEISVAAYPEGHPEATSLDDDIDHLKMKLDAGADRAICQFTLDPADYGRFLERCAKHGITTPVIPGVMSLTLWPRVRRFALRTGTRVPAWLDTIFSGTEGEPEVQRMTAMTVTAEHVRQFVAYGAPGLHFYTLNHWVLPLTAAHLAGRRIGDAPEQRQAQPARTTG